MMQAKLIFSGNEAERPLAELLAAKLSRRQIATVSAIDPASAEARAGDAALVVLFTAAAAASGSVRKAIAAAVEAGVQVFVLRMSDAAAAPAIERLLARTRRVSAQGGDPDRDLSRFANEIASVMERGRSPTARATGPMSPGAIDPVEARISGAPDGLAEAWRAMERDGTNLRWSWQAAAMGPIWTLYRAMPLAGLICLAVLVVTTAIAAIVDLSAIAPLLGFALAWVVLALALGVFGLGMLRNHAHRLAAENRGKEDWFRSVGALGMLASAGFAAFLGTAGDAPSASPAQVPLAGSGGAVPSIASAGLSPNPLRIGDGGASGAETALRWQMRMSLLELLGGGVVEPAAVGVEPAADPAVAAAAAAAAAAADAAADPEQPARPGTASQAASDNEVLDEIFDPVADGSAGQ